MSSGTFSTELLESGSGRSRERRSFWSVIPSWLASLVLHATLLFTFASQITLQGGGDGWAGSGGEGEGYGDVGIYVKKPGDGGADARGAERRDVAGMPEVPMTERTEVMTPAAPPMKFEREAPILSEKPPVPLSTPTTGPSVLGPGPSSLSSVLDRNGGVPSSKPAGAGSGKGHGGIGFGAGTGTSGSGGQGRGIGEGFGPGAGVTKYFGIGDKGARFVYVIDCSGSMTSYNAIRVAKEELVASLESLERTQQFQIIFYNSSPHAMSLAGNENDKLFWATDVNRSRARQYIANVQADLGTDHVPALKMALRLNPEVIFFLTDADQPELSAGELDEIRRLNGGKSRIHCIEFGKGGGLDTPNFLKKLAAQNGGRYRYRDVTSFVRKSESAP